jgi:hypothetical protein
MNEEQGVTALRGHSFHFPSVKECNGGGRGKPRHCSEGGQEANKIRKLMGKVSKQPVVLTKPAAKVTQRKV